MSYKHSTFWLLALSSSLLALSSCHKAPLCDCIDSVGTQTIQSRDLPYFNQLYLEDNVNVFITTGSPEQVQIQGGANLIPNIAANVSGNVLTLKNNNICNWLRSYKKSVINVYITMPTLTSISTNGYGTIQSEGTITTDSLILNTTDASAEVNLNVNAKYVTALLYGTADITLSGYAATFTTNNLGGTGFVYNDSLHTGYTFVSSSSTGDCYVNADSILGVKIIGEGNVYYTGNAKVNIFPGGGSGQLIKL